MSPTRRCRRGLAISAAQSDRGSATVLGLGLIGAIVAGALAANFACFWLISAEKVRVAADLAAVAAADSVRGLITGEPCLAAGQIAHMYMVSLDTCRIVGFESFIRLHTNAAGLTLEAISRAGPAR